MLFGRLLIGLLTGNVLSNGQAYSDTSGFTTSLKVMSILAIDKFTGQALFYRSDRETILASLDLNALTISYKKTIPPTNLY